MKKVIYSLCAAALMLLGTSAYAQLSVNAGYSNSKLTLSTNNKSAADNGFYAGLEYNIPVGNILGFSLGANFEYLLSKNYSLFGVNGSFNETYLNVPAHLNFGYDVSDGIRVFAFAGPTFSYALTGKAESSTLGVMVNVYEDNLVFKALGWPPFNRFDVMVGGGAGLELMDKVRLTFSYDQGMFNKFAKDSEGNEPSNKLTRSVFHAGLAFLF